jgi:hypothetical protein
VNGQPQGDVTPQIYLAWMDAQIRAAKQAGLGVILNFYGAPDWANAQMRTLGPQPARRANFWAPPDDVSQSSPWAYMLYYLAIHYNVNNPNANGAWVDFLEICNEPNLLWWPQVDHVTGYGRFQHYYVAGMMKTARFVTQFTLNRPILLAPGVHDTNITSETTTGVEDFTDNLLGVLASWKGDQYIGWSQHNYDDVKYDRGPGSVNGYATVRATVTRSKLKSFGWKGWPYRDPANPYLMLTEGGVRTNDITGFYNLTGQAIFDKQADLIRKNWNRMHSDSTHSPGIGMVTNYLFYTDLANFDSGLCDDPNYLGNGGYPGDPSPERQPPFNTWRDLPTSAPR